MVLPAPGGAWGQHRGRRMDQISCMSTLLRATLVSTCRGWVDPSWAVHVRRTQPRRKPHRLVPGTPTCIPKCQLHRSRTSRSQYTDSHTVHHQRPTCSTRPLLRSRPSTTSARHSLGQEVEGGSSLRGVAGPARTATWQLHGGRLHACKAGHDSATASDVGVDAQACCLGLHRLSSQPRQSTSLYDLAPCLALAFATSHTARRAHRSCTAVPAPIPDGQPLRKLEHRRRYAATAAAANGPNR